MITPVELYFTEQELFNTSFGTPMIFDVECYPNYFLVSFLHYDTNKICFFELHDDSTLQIDYIKWILRNFCVVGFNSKSYDIVVLSYAISDERIRPSDIKLLSNKLIQENKRSGDCCKALGFSLFEVNHIDLIDVAPLDASLKTYAARLHCEHMQELPYHHESILNREEKNNVRSYNFNDLENTKLLCSECVPWLDLRATLGHEFGKDLRSLSDAQLGQEIINTELQRITGRYPRKPDFQKLVGSRFTYTAPSYIRFNADYLKTMLIEIQQAEIEVGPTGHVICPKSIDGKKIVIADKTYTIGMGGLHSTETCQAVVSCERYKLIDRDVRGYYPNLILKNLFAPAHLGEAYIEVAQTIVDKRERAKRDGIEYIASGMKIACNGALFGKTADPYSTIYSLPTMVQITLTGQLSLLMLIEALTHFGFEVASANTDGIVTIVERSRYDQFLAIIKGWEQVTNLETEETEYKAMYSRDVNNYIAVKAEGGKPTAKFHEDRMGVKAKGVYAERGSALNSVLSKNPECLILADAVIAHIVAGTPLEQTICECQDIRRFVAVRKVVNGAQKDGRYLGKTIRWYYGKGIIGAIHRTNGHMVAMTEGAKPCMRLPATLPDDIDYGRYIEDATAILEKIGYMAKRNNQLKLF